MVKCAARVRSGKVKGCWLLVAGLASDEDPFLFEKVASTDACGQHSQ